MRLDSQKRITAQILKCSPKRIVFDVERLDEIKEAITKVDLRSLIKDKAITKKPVRGISRSRTKIRIIQKRKGRRRGHGTRKGKATARLPRKTAWMQKIRTQRKLLSELKEKEKISGKNFRMLYRKSKGGFFRSRRHMKLYIDEHQLLNKK